MKKKFSIILTLLMVICVLNISQIPAKASFEFIAYYIESTGLVYTPNGTDVSDLSLTGNVYYTLQVINDFSDLQKLELATNAQAQFPNAVCVSEATYAYNCHSYAWYSQDTATNDVWINYPYIYYSSYDMSYVEVDTPRVGDIICYFKAGENIHSGIVIGFSGEESNGVCGNANTVMVRSKWSYYPLYEHKGDECPYVSTDGNGADEVRYYRPRTDDSCTLSGSTSAWSVSEIINSSGTMAETYGMYELNLRSDATYMITIESDDELSNKLYDLNMNELTFSPTASSSGSYTYDLELTRGIYYLRTSYTDSTNSGTISVTIRHDHDYTGWMYYTNSYHIEVCACGATGSTTSSHVVRASQVVNNKANCLVCGYAVSLGTSFFPSICANGQQVSINGSYILDDGVIVLADEDVEAYLNGTLVFYDPSEVPEVS